MGEGQEIGDGVCCIRCLVIKIKLTMSVALLSSPDLHSKKSSTRGSDLLAPTQSGPRH